MSKDRSPKPEARNPYLFGTAHDGTEFITQGRNEQFNEVSK